MPLENHHVFFEPDRRHSLKETLCHLRPWLEENNIKPLALKHTTTPSGSIELQLTFKTRHEASLFEQAFCQLEQA